ncbi:hypothetical protein AB6A40_010351 [Gnathostoma spinigerum]|uniref:Uncharacterized protein n=1 Tax=Gnathostoma spinigerum TaxID=75299 RepID=A0ABD6F2B0_9BILA
MKRLIVEPADRDRWVEHDSVKKRKWNINVVDRTKDKSFDINFFNEAIQTSFDIILFIEDVFRQRRLVGPLSKAIENVAKAVCRLPFFNDISCIPHLALLCNWKVEVEVHPTSLLVPTVNIHFLSNMDVLKEFTWRLSWAGWNRRANFDNFSMSLFGVLSSTPTGSELLSTNVNPTEQIMASTAAVTGLTDLILSNMLFPERGNPIISKFIAKHRDGLSEITTSGYGRRMSILKARLLDEYDIEYIFTKNLEFINYDGSHYTPGQVSVRAIWTMTGLLEQERSMVKGAADLDDEETQRETKLPSLNSMYLSDSAHDFTSESCLRMLFDTFSHWFRVGVDALPLPLLSATVRALTLLSDLLTEIDQYKFVLCHMKALFNKRYLIDNCEFGDVIFSLMKSTAVVGLEELHPTKAESVKIVQGWCEIGLSSAFSEVRLRTLQGVLFLLQSFGQDDLKGLPQLVQTFVQAELQARRPSSFDHGIL